MQNIFSVDIHNSRADGLAQVVEHLPSKHETLSSNSSTEKKIKKLP
jgi:hypothetical protein